MNTTTITQNEVTIANCETFLTTFYQDVLDDLWIEIRCIHPITTEVRSLWIPSNNTKQRNSMIRQANQLNREGYGIYFAPCLRQEQKGTAEHAAVATALWIDIDCDDDVQQRDKALEKLEAFEPAPSIIVDSGGGWHGYWLLDEPYLLAGDEKKHHIAHILKGLFKALDGDESYVKSVASVMRLPDSINTKPERGGVICTIKLFEPERCYALDEFGWLKVEPPKSTFNPFIMIDGKHPLPPRTEDYMASGSSDGSRNSDLFAAACQLRDAQFSQAEAENQLVSRYVADGSSGENGNGREREARKTIASAYSQSARDPISSPRQIAHQKITKLVEQYGIQQEDVKHPSIDELSELIAVCAETMNPLEWAEQRNKFKILTGNGLRISDIDRLYRQKCKEIERERQQNYVETEGYFVADDRMIYRRDTYKGPIEKTVADWTATILHQTCQIDDDGKEIHITKVELHRNEYRKVLEIQGDVFVDDIALRRFIGMNAGSQFIVRAGMSRHLVPAIVGLSGSYPTNRHYSFMGWKYIDERWVYVSPQDCITSKGKLAEPPSVELDNRLRDYGLQASKWEESVSALEAMIAVLPPKLTPALLAFGFLPVIQRFFPAAAPKPAMHLVGTSGSGKSEIASLLSDFYGNFSRDTPPAQWGDTINTVETLGYPLADCLYWVDDYKTIYADERTFTRFLQSYSRGMGRGRLTREAKIRKDRPCRGMVLSTGETTIEGEMSVVARMLVLEIPPWEQRDPQGSALVKAEALRGYLSGFTAHFASWVAQQLDENNLKQELAERFKSNALGFRQKLTAELGGRQANTGRVISNWAVLVTVYQLLSRFLREHDADEILPAWQDVIVESVQTLREERASEVFLDLLSQLIASGQIVLDDNMSNPNEYPSSVQIVGYYDKGDIFLLPEIAHREINKIQALRFTTQAIGMQLKEDGLLIPGTSNLTVQRRVRGSRARLWHLKSDILGCDSCDTCDDD